MIKAQVLIILLFVAVSVGAAEVLHGPVTNSANSHLYYLLTEDSWQNSEAEAVRRNGHLATIRDQAEQEWVFSTFGSVGGTNRSLWIGLREVDSEGNYQWASRETLTYSNWCCSEPNNYRSTESYVHMIKADNGFDVPPGSWNDLDSPPANWLNFNPVHGVIEIDPTPKLTIEVASVAIQWHSLTNITYKLQYRSSLSGNTWTDFGLPMLGNNSNMIVIDPVLGEPRRFYRLRVVP